MAQSDSSKPTPRWLFIARVSFVALAMFAFLFGYQTVTFYTDWHWFGELKQQAVFRTMLQARLTLFFGFGLLAFLIAYFNVWVAQRIAEMASESSTNARRVVIDPQRQLLIALFSRARKGIVFGLCLLLAVAVGGNAAGHWSEYLLFTHAGSFGSVDPIFHRDAGFYVFRLPFLEFLQAWSLTCFGAATTGVVVVHLIHRAGIVLAGGIPKLSSAAIGHLLALGGTVALIGTWGLFLNQFEFVNADNARFAGAGFTDLNARLPALRLQMGALVLTAALCFYNIKFGKPFRVPLIGIGLFVVISLGAGSVWPGFVQKFTVNPNELNLEKQFIARNIDWTRRAYNLTAVREVQFDAGAALTGQTLADNQPTIDNVRLWDWPQLGAVYNAKQAFSNYYRFNLPNSLNLGSGDFNIDVDRYPMDGQPRQVMLGARELYAEGLPREARTWQNLRLQYTHGYGAVMSPVNRVDAEGLPNYFLSEMPVKATGTTIKLDRPQVYYGELARDYVFVDTKQAEFDYSSREGNHETRYSGSGGVGLGGPLSKIAWSVRLGDTNMLLSSDLTEKSRILFRRNIRERLTALAPFIQWDNDPYLVLDGGRMIWMMDGYTTTSRFPYSRSSYTGGARPGTDDEFNYIRNSVKATVDAYDGNVSIFKADETDPILRAWARVFPSLFTPMSAMPPGLRSHIRYPEDLFRIQRDVFSIYHITSPDAFYRKEDQWQIPTDPSPVTDDRGETVQTRNKPLMMPYYVVMKLPGERNEEFLMMTPFSPLNKENMAAWMCARCEPENYGQLVAYRFPKGSNVNGPQQIMNQINSNPDVSMARTLLDKGGSKLIFGNLLVIPVDTALLYVVPIYVQGTDAGTSAIPQIKKVVVATGDRVIMRDTLDLAIAALGGPAKPVAGGQVASPDSAPTASAAKSAIERAREALRRARSKQKEYDAALDDLEKALGALGPTGGKPER